VIDATPVMASGRDAVASPGVATAWRHRHLLDTDVLSWPEIALVLSRAARMAEVVTGTRERPGTLRGVGVTTLFYEASTRTRVSFEVAARLLGADVVTVAAGASSVTKGESLLDTMRTLEALGARMLVIRHATSGAPYLVANHFGGSVLNAGDGRHAHPTQALLDLYTLWRHLGAGDLGPFLAGRKIATSNSYTLHALVTGAHAVPVPLGIARDTLASVRALLERAAAESDLIVSTAGVSVGEHDFVRDALAALGATMDFWRVRMRPGSPLGFAHLGATPWIGLPGNPVSTMVCYELYVRPAVRKMQGHRALHRRTTRVSLAEPVRTAGRLTHFLRAVVTDDQGRLTARLTGPQGSGILTSMAKANALLVVPEDTNELPAGAEATAILLGDARGFTDRPPV